MATSSSASSGSEGASALVPSGQPVPSGQARVTRGWFPESWPERIRALVAGRLTPVPPRRAATVMLLRDSAHGPQVHLLRRRASMAFGPGAYAYPGGGVDPRDEGAGPALPWALGLDPAAAQAVVRAAVRETFEESGVLLAGPDERSLVRDTTGADWEADRLALVARELSFAALLDRRGLRLRFDLLGPWARWVTPEFEERRYDAWFFAAALPEGQRTRDVSGEADHTEWLRPVDAVDAYDRGELVMMPPTIATLRSLAPYGTVAEVIAASRDRDLTPVLARTEADEEEIVVSWPGYGEFTRRISRDPRKPGEPGEPAEALR